MYDSVVILFCFILQSWILYRLQVMMNLLSVKFVTRLVGSHLENRIFRNGADHLLDKWDENEF